MPLLRVSSYVAYFRDGFTQTETVELYKRFYSAFPVLNQVQLVLHDVGQQEEDRYVGSRLWISRSEG